MKFGRLTLSGPQIASICAIFFAAGVLVLNLPLLFSAIVRPAAKDPSLNSLDSKLLASHDEVNKITRLRVDGRSPFHLPAGWSAAPRLPDPPARPTKLAVDDGPKGPPPPPSTYEGPTIVGMFSDRVYFASLGAPGPGLDAAISVGQERDGLKVISVNPPWSARLGHKGGEYDVIFLKTDLPTGFRTSPPNVPFSPVGSGSSSGSDFESASIPPSTPSGRSGTSGSGRGSTTPPRGSSGRDGSSNDNRGSDSSERVAAVPEPIPRDKIDSMSRQQALEALQEVSKARKNANLDEDTKSRLQAEYELLMERIRKGDGSSR